MEDSNNLDLALVMCPGWGVTQPPVGISYLKGFLKNFGIKVKCFDLSLELYKASSQKEYWNLNYPEYFITPELFSRYILPTLGPFINTWAEEILSYEPQVVGFSLFMSSINVSLVLAQQLKKMQPNLTIVGGGAEVTRIKRVLVDGIRGFAPIDKEAVTDSVFDLLIDGEGEESFEATKRSLTIPHQINRSFNSQTIIGDVVLTFQESDFVNYFVPHRIEYN